MIDYYQEFGSATNNAVAWRIIKTAAGSAQYVWTRSASRGSALDVCRVNPTGAYGIDNAGNSYAVVPACEI